MNLVHYNPNNQVGRSVNRGYDFFDSVFDDFLAPLMMARPASSLGRNLQVKVDIYEKENIVCLDAELPGVEKEDISVDIKGRLLTLKAEAKSDDEIKEDNLYRRERRYGIFERSFNLPFEVTSDNIKAHFKNGVLKLEIAKPEEQAAKQILIN